MGDSEKTTASRSSGQAVPPAGGSAVGGQGGHPLSELDGWRIGDTVTVMTGTKAGVIKRIDPEHGLGRWPFLVVFPSREFSWCAGDWLTRVEG